MTFDVTFDVEVKPKVNGLGTAYRPEIPSARVPKRPRATASLSGQLTQTLPLTWHSIFRVKHKDKGLVTDIVPKSRQSMCTKMVSGDSWPLWTGGKTINFDLAFNLPGLIKGQTTG